MKLSKNMKSAVEKFDKLKLYSLAEAVDLLKNMKYSKFDESVDLAINLNVDPRHAEENIRVTTPLPHGTGKSVSVLVLASGAKEKEALDAGADFVGNKDFLTKIKNGWTDVDKIIATPDMMGQVGKLGKVLGPRGLMPNPKTGTVTFDVKQAIEQIQAGKVDYRVDKAGNVHASLGKASFSVEDLEENFKALMAALVKAKPASSKGHYVRGVSVSTTMGVGVRVVYTL